MVGVVKLFFFLNGSVWGLSQFLSSCTYSEGDNYLDVKSEDSVRTVGESPVEFVLNSL